MFEIATVLSITHVSMCHTNLWSFPVLYSMPISEFPIPSSKNRFALIALFSPFYRIWPCAIMARLGEKLQNEIEPIIRDFIDWMEPGTPRVEIESYCREDSCQVFIRFKKSLRNTLCSRPDLKFHLKVMSDICNCFWMIFFYSGDFGILLKKKTLQIAFLTVHHLFWTRFSLQPTYNIIRWVYSWNIYIYFITFQ